MNRLLILLFAVSCFSQEYTSYWLHVKYTDLLEAKREVKKINFTENKNNVLKFILREKGKIKYKNKDLKCSFSANALRDTSNFYLFEIDRNIIVDEYNYLYIWCSARPDIDLLTIPETRDLLPRGDLE